MEERIKKLKEMYKTLCRESAYLSVLAKNDMCLESDFAKIDAQRQIVKQVFECLGINVYEIRGGYKIINFEEEESNQGIEEGNKFVKKVIKKER